MNRPMNAGDHLLAKALQGGGPTNPGGGMVNPMGGGFPNRGPAITPPPPSFPPMGSAPVQATTPPAAATAPEFHDFHIGTAKGQRALGLEGASILDPYDRAVAPHSVRGITNMRGVEGGGFPGEDVFIGAPIQHYRVRVPGSSLPDGFNVSK